MNFQKVRTQKANCERDFVSDSELLRDGRAVYRSTDEIQDQDAAAGLMERRIVVLSDLQSGADLTALQSYRWPDEILVELREIDLPGENASVHPVESVPEGELEADQIRIRVVNDGRSSNDTFDLFWRKASNGETLAKTVQVAPGRNRVFDIRRPPGAEVLRLSGDRSSFDNLVYYPENSPNQRTLLFIGSNDQEAEGDLSYFLRRAPLGTPLRPIEARAGARLPR